MSEKYTNEEILSKIEEAKNMETQELNKEASELYSSLLNKTDDKFLLCEIYRKLGDLYYKIGSNENAIWAYEKFTGYRQDNAVIYNRLGYMYFYRDSDKSIENYLKKIELQPDLPNFIMLTQVMIKSIKYTQKDLKEIFEKYVDVLRPQVLNGFAPYTYNPKDYDKNKKIRLGYISSDFYNHAMMSFVLPIIENHDLNKFDVILYQAKDKQDAVTERLKASITEYNDCSKMKNEEIAKKIHEDKIDILIDLCGYTYNSVLVSLYKPAPVIVQYLGFLGTFGMKEVDYILTDKFTIPWNIAKYYTEKPMYIDTVMNRFTFQLKDRTVPEPTPLPYEQNGYITLGSFNSISKINPYTIKLWSDVLKAIPNSKLIIYRTQMEQRDIDRFKIKFSANGIDLNRVIFDNEPMKDNHMNSYLKCDFALDPIPFSGLTITIEQAYMGVPVLTMTTDTIASKGTARVNRALGLKNFIAKDEKDYVKKAVKIASDIKKLRYYRKNLPQIVRKSVLCTGFKDFTRKIEKEYVKAWKKFCR